MRPIILVSSQLIIREMNIGLLVTVSHTTLKDVNVLEHYGTLSVRKISKGREFNVLHLVHQALTRLEMEGARDL